MKLKIHHYLHHAQGRAHAERRRGAGKHSPHRHYSVPIGNRMDALRDLQDLFGINDGGVSPKSVMY